MNEETTPQRARRLGKEYGNRFHDRWSHASRKWITFAFARGYQQACIDFAAEAEAISTAVDAWEADGDDEELVNQHLDPWLILIASRGEDPTKAAA